MNEFITEYPTYSKKPYPLKTYLGVPVLPIILAITSIASAGGWFTQSSWAEEIAGKLTDDHATGGIIDELEAQTGKSYPDLQRMRQQVVNAWRTFQRAAPWNKASTVEAYQTRVQELSRAVQSEAEAYQREISPLGTIARAGTALGEAIASPEWWKRYLPWIGVGGLVIILITISLRRGK